MTAEEVGRAAAAAQERHRRPARLPLHPKKEPMPLRGCPDRRPLPPRQRVRPRRPGGQPWRSTSVACRTQLWPGPGSPGWPSPIQSLPRSNSPPISPNWWPRTWMMIASCRRVTGRRPLFSALFWRELIFWFYWPCSFMPPTAIGVGARALRVNYSVGVKPARPDNPAGFRAGIDVFSARMFDLVKPQIATAADKLTHLRRFL